MAKCISSQSSTKVEPAWVVINIILIWPMTRQGSQKQNKLCEVTH